MVEGTELTPGGASITRLRSTRRVSDAISKLLLAYDQLRDGLMDQKKSAVSEGLAAIKLIDLESISQELERGRTPATSLEIEAAIGRLVAVTKHLNKVDGPLFHESLSEFVQHEQPTRLGLAESIRRIIVTVRYTPSIAEVVETLRAVESDLRSAATRLERLPEKISEAEAFLLRST